MEGESPMTVDVHAILKLHAQTVARWHAQEIDNPYEGFLRDVCLQHEQNFRLWHQEDIARSQDVSNAELAAVKRAIDKLNQQRNDLIERLDDRLIEQLSARGVEPWQGARLNTETPGSVIDRLSIVSLRLFHMEEQAARRDATEEHVAKVRARLEILHEQHADLSNSLCELLDDIFAGRKRLRVYRQFKMYNDPTMNPYLYAAKRPAA
jgi:cell division protein FtsB